MKSTLFNGVLQTWYLQRLQQMFKSRPMCKYLHKINHLIGTCPTCGQGNFHGSDKFKLQPVTIHRIYMMFKRDVKHLKFVLKYWPGALTNLEFPLPLIKYHTTIHIPKFYDGESNTVIDFLPNTPAARRLLRATDIELKSNGFNYVVFDKGVEVYRRGGSCATFDRRISESEYLLVSAMRNYIKTGAT